jgi:cellulose synthase/poly-beta-1,6-N-acetylglucosamine synthase-like glycosyltransferase
MSDGSVSVVVPTHGRPQLLSRALASLLAQTRPPAEVHVVENGSRGGAREVVADLGGDARGLRYHFLPQADLHLARNHGLRRCRGEFVAFLDDDDEWLPEKLQRQVGRLQAERSLGWIGCRVWRVEPSGAAALAESPFYRGEPTLLALVREGCFLWTPSAVVVRRQCLQRVGPFSLRYRIAGDYDLYLRLARQFRFAVLEEPLVRYHRHPGNMSRSLDRAWGEILEILARLRPCPAQGLTRRIIRDVIRQYGRWLYGLATHAREQGRPAQAARCLATALRFDPGVGLRVPWSRFRQPLYRATRPDLLLLRDVLDSLTP